MIGSYFPVSFSVCFSSEYTSYNRSRYKGSIDGWDLNGGSFVLKGSGNRATVTVHIIISIRLHICLSILHNLSLSFPLFFFLNSSPLNFWHAIACTAQFGAHSLERTVKNFFRCCINAKNHLHFYLNKNHNLCLIKQQNFIDKISQVDPPSYCSKVIIYNSR